MSGKLFFIEGPDGVGKATTIDLLKDALVQRSGRFEFLSFPGKAEGTLAQSFIVFTTTRRHLE
ncbi:hypothetical protein ACFX5Q_32285 [Mesorhizobium sp. IMUNJ 23033]|uniref:hypothetical protein n=1 Tax=Mesorhizobium sp. IMUNJ 23033 TaxID=3378039 RepID=UPI00384B77CC